MNTQETPDLSPEAADYIDALVAADIISEDEPVNGLVKAVKFSTGNKRIQRIESWIQTRKNRVME